MDKTIKINLAGIVFQIEEDAYHLLRDYLQSLDSRLKNSPGGNETLDDIESRIAEIFQSQKGLAGILTRQNVEAMIAIIGKPEDFEPGTDSRQAPGYSSGRRRLFRNPDETIISGVCGGIGSYLNIDPVWIRLIFIIFTFAGGIGFFVYIALWIALPSAYSESQKRELYGDSYQASSQRSKKDSGGQQYTADSYGKERTAADRAGNAMNEVFRAVGNVFYVFFRIILVALGVTFVLAGFATLVTFIMTFFFRYPWFFFDESANFNNFYIPGVLEFFMNPQLVPWVTALLSVVVILPLLALIYWGIRMIFWFRAKDWVVSLVALVVWVMSLSTLAIIAFNQGISFAENGSRTDQTVIEGRSDTLYLKIDRKIASLKYDQEFSVPDNEYALYLNRQENELYGKPGLNIHYSESRDTKLTVERYSHGKTRREAVEKAESLIYNYRVSGDTIYLDQYYTVPDRYRWSGSWVEADIEIPGGTVIWIDSEAELLFDNYPGNGVNSWELGDNYWVWTEEGPESTMTVGKKDQ